MTADRSESPRATESAETERALVSRAATRGMIWTGVQMVGSHVLSLVVFVVLGRILSPRDFGLIASATVVILFLRVLVDAGFSRLIVQRETLTPEHVDTAFWTALILGVTFALSLTAAAPLVAALFGQPRLTNIVRALSVVFIFVSLDGTQSALLERRMEFRAQAVRRLVAGLVSTAIAITLAVLGAGVWALVAQQLTLEGVTVLVLWTLADWHPQLRFSPAAFRELAAFGLRYCGTQTLVNLGANADNFLVALILGPVALGYYVIAYRVFTVASEVLVLTVNRVALTTFSRLQRDTEALNASFISSTTMTAFLTLPCFAVLGLLAHTLITFVFGAKWAPSAPVLQVLTVAGVMQGQVNFTGNYAIAVGRISNQLLWLACLVAAQLAGFGIAVSFGIVAVGASLSAVMVIAWPVRLIQVSRWRGLDIRLYFTRFAQLAAATGVMLAAMWGVGRVLSGSAVPVLILQVLVGAVCYIGAATVLAPRATAELRAELFRAHP